MEANACARHRDEMNARRRWCPHDVMASPPRRAQRPPLYPQNIT